MIFDTYIAGVRHKDGAQYAIRNFVSRGDHLALRREPQNKFDKNAISVWHGDTPLGFVPADKAERIAPLMDRGEEVICIFHAAPAAIVLRTQSDC